jgi:hypothetical protein
MKPTLPQLAAFMLAAFLLAGGGWWWSTHMEKHWEVHTKISEAAQKNPMLAATRLLNRYRHPVTVQDTLGSALIQPLPRGTMLIVDNNGILTQQQTNQLLAWVAQGNTLIVSPKWVEKGEAVPTPGRFDVGAKKPTARPAVPSTAPSTFERSTGDPLGEHFGVAQALPSHDDTVCRAPGEPLPPMQSLPPKAPNKVNVVDCVASIVLPGASYPIRIDSAVAKLGSRRQTPEMLFSDQDAQTVRVYAYGKGQVAFVAHNYFDNNYLPLYDHAELLLGLVGLNHDATPVLMVRKLDSLVWYRALWAMAPLAIVSLGIGLLMLTWKAVRRFGPILPEPNGERRSLMEHIDASGRWLWKTPAGRDILLAAARAEFAKSAGKIMARRLPALQSLPQEQHIHTLAQQTRLAPLEVTDALHTPASRTPVKFIRQIETLQRMRKYYEC